MSQNKLIEESDLYWAEQLVIQLRRLHSTTWRDKDEHYWLARLMEEIGELAGSLVGNHDDPVEWELKQISAICINWLEMRMQNERLSESK